MKKIATILSSLDGSLNARITTNNKGQYVVSLEDKEANQVLPTLIIFDKEDKAIQYAKKCVDFN